MSSGGNEGQEHVQLEKTTSSMLVTPKKKVNLDVDNLDEVSSVDLQILINQRLQRSRSSSKNIPSRSSSSGKARNQDGSPNSISNTPEGSGSNEFGSGKRFDATWTTPGGQAIQFNFMSKNIPTTPEVVKRDSTCFPADKYDAVWHNTSPWKPKRSSPLRNNNRNHLREITMKNSENHSPYQQAYNNLNTADFSNLQSYNLIVDLGNMHDPQVHGSQQHHHVNRRMQFPQHMYGNDIINGSIFDPNLHNQNEFANYEDSQ